MKKELTFEELEKRKKTNTKILKFGCLPVAIILVVIIAISTLIPAKVSNNNVKTNMDSLITVIKKDAKFDVKEVFYKNIDSSLNITFTNRGDVIKKELYSTDYFNETYHLDDLYDIDGVSLYEFKKGVSNNDYKNPLASDSRRLGELEDKFNKKYYVDYLGAYKPVYDYLKEYLDDPSSLEISKSFFIGANANKSFEIKTVFRAKNKFGAMIINTINCDVDMNGNVSNIEMNK